MDPGLEFEFNDRKKVNLVTIRTLFYGHLTLNKCDDGQETRGMLKPYYIRPHANIRVMHKKLQQSLITL